MGGKTGGISYGDVKRLEETAKKKLAEAGSDAKHVFISFANEDLGEVNLFRGQAKNEKSEFTFDDYSVKVPYDSENAEYIRNQIREKITRVSVTCVYLTNDAAQSRWVNWEIEESIKQGKRVIGVYKGASPPASVPLAFSANKCKAVPWTHAELKKAIENK
jgi:hypothetical protein